MFQKEKMEGQFIFLFIKEKSQDSFPQFKDTCFQIEKAVKLSIQIIIDENGTTSKDISTNFTTKFCSWEQREVFITLREKKKHTPKMVSAHQK